MFHADLRSIVCTHQLPGFHHGVQDRRHLCAPHLTNTQYTLVVLPETSTEVGSLLKQRIASLSFSLLNLRRDLTLGVMSLGLKEGKGLA